MAAVESHFSRSSRMEAMCEMASAISFDLTDMTTVMQYKISCIRRAIEQGTPTQSVLKDVEKIAAVLSRMASIAKGMRAMGLVGEEDGFKVCSLPELMKQVVDLSSPWFQAQHIEFECLPVPNATLKCRPAQIAQAIINLLNNAIEATSRLPEKKVTMGFSMEGRSPVMLQVSVTDTGTIAEPVRARLLEPFFSTKPRGKGMGLGLNVVKSIAEAHSGKVFLDPASAQTRFVFEVPVTDVHTGSA